MTNDQKDAICELWIQIFGTQEGAGYNCPQGAYDFAEVVMAYEREACAKVCENLYKNLNYDADCRKRWPHTKMMNDQYAAAIRAWGGK